MKALSKIQFMMLVMAVIVLACLVGCSNSSKDSKTTQNENPATTDALPNDGIIGDYESTDSNQEDPSVGSGVMENTSDDKETIKLAKVIKIADNMVVDYGRWASKFLAAPIKEIVATDGKWYIICMANETNQLFVGFYVDSFYYDIDGELRANAIYDIENHILMASCDNNSIKVFAKKNGWWEISDDHIIQEAIDKINGIPTTNVNQTAIPNSSVETDNAANEINNEEPNIDPIYMWAGRDVFSTFYNEYFAEGGALGWEHLGICGDYFFLPGKSVPEWVDVYRIYVADGSSDSFFIVPYGEIQLTEVYESTNGKDTKLIWSIPLEAFYSWMKNDDPADETPEQYAESVPYVENILRADQPIYAGPGYGYTYVGTVQVAGLYTIVEETLDDEGNLWGKLKSGVGWIDLTNSRG